MGEGCKVCCTRRSRIYLLKIGLGSPQVNGANTTSRAFKSDNKNSVKNYEYCPFPALSNGKSYKLLFVHK
ncbi:hypothetical protein ABFA07_003704 [Porites harrisoni]